MVKHKKLYLQPSGICDKGHVNSLFVFYSTCECNYITAQV